MAHDEILNAVVLNVLQDAENEVLVDEGRNVNLRDIVFDMSNESFQRYFRLTKLLVLELTEMVRPFMRQPRRMSYLDIEIKVLVALRFFATGSYQLDIGSNIYFGVSQPSVSKILHEVIDAVNQPEIMDGWISFPDTLDELRELRERFNSEHDFPGAFGCIDGTFVAIFPPPVHDEENPEHIFVSRMGYHAINVQLVCDWRMKIINVNARFPGSTYDSYIFNNNNVSRYLIDLHEQSRQPDFFLLGDSGYALRSYMMTPITNPQPNTPEALYNTKHVKARSLIERCNGVLKIRFRCLSKHRVLNYAPLTASKIINTCVVLHNMCIENNVPIPALEEEDIVEEENDGDNFEALDEPYVIQGAHGNHPNAALMRGRAQQEKLIRHYFT